MVTGHEHKRNGMLDIDGKAKASHKDIRPRSAGDREIEVKATSRLGVYRTRGTEIYRSDVLRTAQYGAVFGTFDRSRGFYKNDGTTKHRNRDHPASSATLTSCLAAQRGSTLAAKRIIEQQVSAVATAVQSSMPKARGVVVLAGEGKEAREAVASAAQSYATRVRRARGSSACGAETPS